MLAQGIDDLRLLRAPEGYLVDATNQRDVLRRLGADVCRI
jgi:hypothetical protein